MNIGNVSFIFFLFEILFCLIIISFYKTETQFVIKMIQRRPDDVQPHLPNVLYLFARSQPLVILGELSKLVHMSPQRVISLQYATDDVSLTIKGKPGELVTFYFRYAVSPVKIQCTISGLGTAVISWAKQSCH